MKFNKELNHSASHVMAMAVLKLWPDTKLGFGPPTEEGFYYLLQPKKNYTQEDIDKLSNHIYNGAILTEEEEYLYDVNNDEVLNLQDIVLMSWTIQNNISNSITIGSLCKDGYN